MCCSSVTLLAAQAVFLVVALVRADISDQNPPPDICLCVNIDNSVVRDSGLYSLLFLYCALLYCLFIFRLVT